MYVCMCLAQRFFVRAKRPFGVVTLPYVCLAQEHNLEPVRAVQFGFIMKINPSRLLAAHYPHKKYIYRLRACMCDGIFALFPIIVIIVVIVL